LDVPWQNDPGVHGRHTVTLAAPVTLLNVPAGQASGLAEPWGQYPPGGQIPPMGVTLATVGLSGSTGARLAEPARQKYPSAHNPVGAVSPIVSQ
jgi:hypothetical protein